MRRLILVAIGLAALLWTASARIGPVSPDGIMTMSRGGPCMLASDSDGQRDSDQRWQARHHTIAAVTESVWKSAPVHADLAATRRELSVETPPPGSLDPPVRPLPQYLRHTPLLI